MSEKRCGDVGVMSEKIVIGFIIIAVIFIGNSIERPTPTNYKPLSVERVIDGDTFIASGTKIRLWGIDAPEKEEPHYRNATRYLATILKTGKLECTFIEKDRYQRDVMKCLIDDVDVGERLVTEGLARDYGSYSNDYYATFERQAKRRRRGIWSNDNLN